ncbi:amidohydrolase [Microdochium bolleyi]|uniref:Amidohydrolase n=1 Tax=Microdochium bolleyi TaxID=196109 RepID=A0A136IT77_9PEZI|nr:amidohydrolase [Microdochium bolleyi]
MSSTTSLLLRGGTLLLHDDTGHVRPTVADVLVEGALISNIAAGIAPPSKDTRVIDVTGKIIGPGYVDTHHHLWQTQNKGVHGDHTLVRYLPSGNNLSVLYSTKDLFYGQLSGALEAIDGGTTTVVDHAHCNPSTEHPHAAVQALITSGLRCVYCLSPRISPATSNPPTVKMDFYASETVEAFRALAAHGPYGSGRIHIGQTLDNVYASGDAIREFYSEMRGGKDKKHPAAKIITTHAARGPYSGGDEAPSVIQTLHSHGVLGPDVLISHGNFPCPDDGKLYADSGAHVSSTPNTELQMGVFPIALRPDHQPNASLGVDCHSWGAGDMATQMRMMLQAARVERGEKLAAGTAEGHEGRKLWSIDTGFTCEDVYNLGTIGGAKAAGLADEVGRLKIGYKADMVVYETDSPRMLAAAVENPIAAIVLHSCPADISMVVVDGIVRKEDARLVDLVVAPAESAPHQTVNRGAVEPGTRLTWKDVATEVIDSRLKLKEKTRGLDFKAAEDLVVDAFHWDRKSLLEAQT